MATSGLTKVNVTNWDVLQFAWERTSYSIETNSTTISWELTLISGSSGAIYSSANKSWAVSINGQNYSGTNTVGIGNNTSKILAKGTSSIAHDPNGHKAFSYSFGQAFNITFSSTYIGTIYGNGYGELEPIPRQATLTWAPNFDDTQNPTITYSNPAGDAVASLQACISWTGSDDIVYRDIPKTGTSYTFKLSDADKNALYSASSTANAIPVVFYVKTVIGAVTYLSTLTRTFSVKNSMPTLAPIVEDYGETSFELTGDRNKIIRGFNYVKVAANAVAKKGATIVSKTITCNGASYTRVDNDAGWDGYFSNVDGSEFIFTVKDSRGNVARQTITKNLINYIPITTHITPSYQFTSATNDKVDIVITISGKCFTGSFGNYDNGVGLKYRYKIGTATYPEYTNALGGDILYGSNTYSYSFSILNVDYSSSLMIDVGICDEVADFYYTEYPIHLKPVFDWGKNDFRVNVLAKLNAGVSISGNQIDDFNVTTGTENADVIYDDAKVGTIKWHYKKENSGWAECYGTAVFTISNPGIHDYSGYRYSNAITVKHPAGLFLPEQRVTSIVDGGSTAYVNTLRVAYTESPHTVLWLVALIAPDTAQATAHIHAYGRWK